MDVENLTEDEVEDLETLLNRWEESQRPYMVWEILLGKRAYRG